MKLTLDPGAAALLDTLHAAGYAAAYGIGCVARRVQGVQQGSCPGVKCQLHSSFSS